MFKGWLHFVQLHPIKIEIAVQIVYCTVLNCKPRTTTELEKLKKFSCKSENDETTK